MASLFFVFGLLLFSQVINVEAACCSGMNTNQAALNLIKSFEGYFANFYTDPVGIRTIGYGHACHVNDCNNLKAKRSDGQIYTATAPLSKQEAEDLLRWDLENKGYESCVRSNVDVNLSPNQFGALVSFVFNVGCGGFGSSTLLRRINSGASDSSIKDAFLMWVNGGGRRLPGLVRRRNAEADLFINGGGTSDSSFPPCHSPSSGLGVCKDTSECSATTVSGVCPGAANIQCCIVNTNAESPCPTGSSWDRNFGFCTDGTNVYGPFTKRMSDRCAAFGGGSPCTTKTGVEVVFKGRKYNIELLRWAKTFAENLRGKEICPDGSKQDVNYAGHCTEDLGGGNINVYGPFGDEMVEACRVSGGGNACLTGRWSGPFFASLLGKVSQTQGFEITEQSDNSTSNPFADDMDRLDPNRQQEKEDDEKDSSGIVLHLSAFLIVLSFFFALF